MSLSLLPFPRYHYYRSNFYCACRTGIASWKTLAACYAARRSPAVTNTGYKVCR